VALDQDWPFFLAPVEIREALLDLFSDYPFQGAERATGLDEIHSHYEKLSGMFGFTLHPPNLLLSQVSDHLVERGEYQKALSVLNRLVEIYPSSLNGPWRLANLHRVMGDTTAAIRYYEECLRRDPNMTLARDWLDRLREGK
jgi:tetratricopeptide (TPR) repeat protein